MVHRPDVLSVCSTPTRYDVNFRLEDIQFQYAQDRGKHKTHESNLPGLFGGESLKDAESVVATFS